MCECNKAPQIVEDYARGDRVCTGCGVVLESHIIDERHERYLTPVDARADRVDTTTALLGHSGVHLQTSRGRMATKYQSRDPSSSIKEGFACVDNLCAGWLNDGVRHMAKQVYRDYCQAINSSVSSQDSRQLYAAASMLLAVRVLNVPRTEQEVGTRCGVDIAKLRRTSYAFQTKLEGQPYFSQTLDRVRPNDMINRTVDGMRALDDTQRKQVKREAHRLSAAVEAAGLLTANRASSVCGAVLFIVIKRLCIAVSDNDVAAACKVSASTIAKVANTINSSLAPLP